MCTLWPTTNFFGSLKKNFAPNTVKLGWNPMYTSAMNYSEIWACTYLYRVVRIGVYIFYRIYRAYSVIGWSNHVFNMDFS